MSDAQAASVTPNGAPAVEKPQEPAGFKVRFAPVAALASPFTFFHRYSLAILPIPPQMKG